MRVLVLSDNHRITSTIYKIIDKVQPVMIFHLGDGEGSVIELSERTHLPIHAVAGNCDFGRESLPKNLVVTLGNRQILLTHGHLYGVKSGHERLVYEAKERGCDTVIYGHTHVPEIEEVDGVTVMNPGSIEWPKQFDMMQSFGIINVDDNGNCEFAIRYWDDGEILWRPYRD